MIQKGESDDRSGEPVFDSYIAFHARTRPSAPAVVATDGSVTFEKFNRDIDRAATELAHLSIAPTELVAVTTAVPYLEWVLVLALARLGIASAPASDTGSVTIVGDGTRRPDDVDRLLDRTAIERIFSGPVSEVAAVRPDPGALARVLQSSGTTGERKRVGMSWTVIDAAIRNAFIAYGSPSGPWLAATGIDTILGLVVTLACWASGNPAVLGMTGRLDPAKLAKLRPRMIALVPDQLKQLLDDLPAAQSLEPLRIVSGGGPVPPSLARRVREHCAADLRSVYGASETGSVAVAGLDMLEQQPGAAGVVLPLVKVEVVDDHGQTVPRGKLGRIRVSSDRVADHFVGEAVAGERCFDTGDLGRLGADGTLFVDGRTDDIMNLAGHKVLPAWVEAAALGCPGVADAAAFAVPDNDGLDRCWLAVVATDDFDEARLTQALATRLHWISNIRLIRLDRLPRNAMGKVERDQLRALAKA